MYLKKYLSGIFILLISTQTFAVCETERENFVQARKITNSIEKFTPRVPVENMAPTDFSKLSDIEFESELKNIVFGIEQNRLNIRNRGSNHYFESALTSYVYEHCLIMDEKRNRNSKSGNSTQSQINNSNQSQPSESQQAQQIQQTMQQAQQQAQQNQQRADQVREGKRKTHDAGAEAHDCIEVDTKSLYGGFKNKCSYPVSYGYCINNPRKGALTDSPLFSCAGMAAGKPTAGGQSIRANGYDSNHTKGGDAIYYFACKQPAYAMDLTAVIGQGIQGRCGTIGGN